MGSGLGQMTALLAWGFLEWFFVGLLSLLTGAVGLFALFVFVQLFRNPGRRPQGPS
jgi:hypothetical protein